MCNCAFKRTWAWTFWSTFQKLERNSWEDVDTVRFYITIVAPGKLILPWWESFCCRWWICIKCWKKGRASHLMLWGHWKSSTAPSWHYLPVHIAIISAVCFTKTKKGPHVPLYRNENPCLLICHDIQNCTNNNIIIHSIQIFAHTGGIKT